MAKHVGVNSSHCHLPPAKLNLILSLPQSSSQHQEWEQEMKFLRKFTQLWIDGRPRWSEMPKAGREGSLPPVIQILSPYTPPLNLPKLECRHFCSWGSVQHSLVMDLGPYFLRVSGRHFGLVQLPVCSDCCLSSPTSNNWALGFGHTYIFLVPGVHPELKGDIY